MFQDYLNYYDNFQMLFKSSDQIRRNANSLLDESYTLPFFIKRGKGSFVYDFDQNKFVDYYLNNGSLILGHANPLITKVVKNDVSKAFVLPCPNQQKSRLANIILECYSTIDKISFYPSFFDCIKAIIQIVKVKSDNRKVLFLGEKYQLYKFHNMLSFPDFDINKIESFIQSNTFSAICLEPIKTYPSLKIYEDGFLDQIQELCKKFSLSLILDEEISGFRLSINGASGLYKIEPEIVILGPVIGGGFPLYALGLKNFHRREQKILHNEIFESLKYTAGIETIKYLKRKAPYVEMAEKVNYLKRKIINDNIKLTTLSSLFSIEGLSQTKHFIPLLEKKILLYPPIDRCHFISTCHTMDHIQKLVQYLNLV